MTKKNFPHSLPVISKKMFVPKVFDRNSRIAGTKSGSF